MGPICNLNKLVLMLLFFLTSNFLIAQSDATREAWDRAKNLCNENGYLKAKEDLLIVYKEMPRPLCCHWLGMAYDIEQKRDSAIFYYEKAIESGGSKPQLASWDNLIRAHMRQLDFQTAYSIAWDALAKFPGNKVFIEEFKEVCKWAYFIEHLDFNKHYLTNTQLHKEYQIKTITEQELIVMNIRNNQGQHLHVGNRQYKGHFEIWKCRFNNSKEDIEIKFHLHDHNLDDQIQKQHEKAKSIFNDENNSMIIRLGALLSLTPLNDKQISDLLASTSEEVRLCACAEVINITAAKIKKSCLNDKSAIVKAMCENLEIFKEK